MSLVSRALQAVLAAALAPSLVAAEPYHDNEHTEHRDDGDFLAADMAVGGQRMLDLLLPNGNHQRVLYAAPLRPWAAIVMLPGGAGDLGVEHDGNVRHDQNFVVRTRALWTARGYAVLIPYATDHANLRGVRSTRDYGRLVNDLIGFAHAQASGPVFLLGISQGSIAAVNGAAQAAPGSVAGVVLTESVSRGGGSSHETIFSADPQDVTAPVLIVANRDDTCNVAPPEDAPRIAAAMTHSRDVRVLLVAGGITKSRRACGPLTPHGYYGIETPVIEQISDWMRAHGQT